MERLRTRRAKYPEQLYVAEPSSKQLLNRRLPNHPSTKQRILSGRGCCDKVEGGTAARVCNGVSVELLSVDTIAINRGLHAVLTIIWPSDIPVDAFVHLFLVRIFSQLQKLYTQTCIAWAHVCHVNE